jgi:ATP-dependent Clp protease ATP-binding subunit ClpA
MLSKNLESTLHKALALAKEYKHEYATLEHLLLALLEDPDVITVMNECATNKDRLVEQLHCFLSSELQVIILKNVKESKPTEGFQRVVHRAAIQVHALGKEEINGVNVLSELFSEQDSYAVSFLNEQKLTRERVTQFMSHLMVNTEVSGKVNNLDLARPKIQGSFSTATNHPEKKDSNDPLEKYCVNFNKLGSEHKIDTLVGRDIEIERMVEVLSRRSKNNPLLIGSPGVGKTAIVEGLALYLSSKDAPEALKGATVYSLDMGLLVAGTRFRGDFEERLKQVIDKIQTIPGSILFIDEIHTIIGAGSSSQGGGMDAANILKPILARGDLRCVGATTFKEYKNYLEKDVALARRFQKIMIDEPSEEVAIAMLMGLKPLYEKHHNVEYSEQAIEAAVLLSNRYINDRSLPDKAVDVMDEAGAYCRINNKNKVTEEDIENIIVKIVHIPVKSIAQDDSEQVMELANKLKSYIFG